MPKITKVVTRKEIDEMPQADLKFPFWIVESWGFDPFKPIQYTRDLENDTLIMVHETDG